MTIPSLGHLHGPRTLPESTHPFLIPLLPLLLLALATTTAFAVAIHGHWADLSSLWTQCSSSSSSSNNSIPVVGWIPRLPTPFCFAVHFFQAALASRRGRLEEAVIVGLLAGLATVTAVEAARARSWTRVEVGRHDRQLRESPHLDKKSGRHDTTGSTTTSSSNTNNSSNTNSSSSRTLSARIVENPTLPWLLYNLALGALSWQLIIIPASLIRETVLWRQQQQQREEIDARPRTPTAATPATLLPGGGGGGESGVDSNPTKNIVSVDGPPSAVSSSVVFSITLGLLLPSTLMLTTTAATTTCQTVIILIWLVFPVWVHLVGEVVFPALSSLSLSSSSSSPSSSSPMCSTRTSSVRMRTTTMTWAVPVLYSAIAHVLLIADVLHPSGHTSPSPLAVSSPSSSSFSSISPSSSPPPPSPASRAALLLLEIDHVAIFTAYLYWLLVTTTTTTTTTSSTPAHHARIRALAIATLSTLLLGPGAGVCLGWACRDDGSGGHRERHGTLAPRASGRGGGEAGAALKLPGAWAGSPRRRTRGATTGNFFGGPDA